MLSTAFKRVRIAAAVAFADVVAAAETTVTLYMKHWLSSKRGLYSFCFSSRYFVHVFCVSQRNGKHEVYILLFK